MYRKPDGRTVAVAAELARMLPQRWAAEIERAIDKVKGPKRTSLDRWFRKQFYRAEWRMRNVKGPTVTYD